MYYIYLHRRPDTNTVFYVGRGKHYKRSILYRRAFDASGRNNIWNGIVSRNDGNFIVEILIECNSYEDAIRLEQEAISAFGKIIDKTGPLCNLTAGGEGAESYKHTEESKAKLRLAHARNPSRLNYLKTEEYRRKHSEFLKGNKHSLGIKASAETRAKLSASHKGKNGRQIIDRNTGNIFNTVKEASASVGIHVETLYKYLQGKRINYTSLRYV